ncbi:PIF1 helicase, partial [Acromyrmex heyeri]
GNVVAINRSVNGNCIDSIKIVFSFHKMVVHRKQFPLPLSYGITIHKNQGITCKNAMMDLGTSVFSDGQAYVGLSRVSTLEGLHLINFPASIKADVQNYGCEEPESIVTWKIYGLCNDDHISCYANIAMCVVYVSGFFTVLMSTYFKINNVLEFELKHVTFCSNAKLNYNTVIKSTLSVLLIQLNLYTFLNGVPKKIINKKLHVYVKNRQKVGMVLL